MFCLFTEISVSADDGQLLCWGWNKYGQVWCCSCFVFPRFALLSGYQCVVVYLSCIPLVTQQLGLGDTIDRNIPTQVELDGCRLRKVACGWWHTLLLADSPTWANHQILRTGHFQGFHLVKELLVGLIEAVHTEDIFCMCVSSIFSVFMIFKGQIFDFALYYIVKFAEQNNKSAWYERILGFFWWM